jgi:hypothetical protein
LPSGPEYDPAGGVLRWDVTPEEYVASFDAALPDAALSDTALFHAALADTALFHAALSRTTARCVPSAEHPSRIDSGLRESGSELAQKR